VTGAIPLRRVARAAPRAGGTLRLYGSADVELDPVTASEPPAATLARLISRQLVTYEACSDPCSWQAIAPVPDVAVDVPSTYNAGLGASHRCYVVHLRPGVFWDTAPVRPVTAQDFVRGFKRMGNPVTRSPTLAYFASTIRGMADFCAGYVAAVDRASPTADQLAAYQNANDITGVFVLDDTTLVIELLRPTPEFVSMLALPCASAAPVEYDAVIPGSPEFRANMRANGPYRVALDGPVMHLERNPAWRRETDPVRRAHVDRIVITREDAGPARIAARIGAGSADAPWMSPLRAPRAGAPAPPGLGVAYALDPYLVFNVADGAVALCDVRVRQALSAAIDRAALADRYMQLDSGGPVLAADRIVPPGNDPASGAGDAPRVDRDRARFLLADAGFADGLTLTAVCRDRCSERDLAQVYAADLQAVGVEVRVVALADDAYRHAVLRPAGAVLRGWDLTTRSWSAGWLHRNGRAVLQPLFETGASANYGGYSNPAIDELIERALDAAVEPRAKLDAAWRAVEDRVLADVAIVPLLFRAPAVPQRRGENVRDAIAIPAAGYADDLASIWLDSAEDGASPRAGLLGEPSHR
jgi:peptide/nickel transport system substrate-binding protein